MASTDTPNSRAAELAAEQVESILVAAEAAAQRLRDEAAEEAGRVRATGEEEARAVERAAQDAREQALADAERLRADAERLWEEAQSRAVQTEAAARREAEAELDSARRDAVKLGDEAQGEAARTREEMQVEVDRVRERARADAAQVGEEARAAASKRVAGAKTAADEALEEARAVSSGLRRLADSLTAQSERILRDVQAAHRQISSDLRVASGGAREEGSPRADSPARAGAGERPRRRATGEPRTDGPGARRPPFEDMRLPSWVERG